MDAGEQALGQEWVSAIGIEKGYGLGESGKMYWFYIVCDGVRHLRTQRSHQVRCCDDVSKVLQWLVYEKLLISVSGLLLDR
jgi:hypothetical protein